MKIDKAFPPEKIIECLFCGAEVKLTRRGSVLSNGTPRFWYVESEWAAGGENHYCVWTVERPEKAGPVPEPPVVTYGPWRVSFWEPRRKKEESGKPVQSTLDEWF